MEQLKPKRYTKEQMRAYMKARYDANPEQGATISKINYYKKKGYLTKDEIKKYGEVSPYIAKVKKSLDDLKELSQQTLEEFIFDYLEQLVPENI